MQTSRGSIVIAGLFTGKGDVEDGLVGVAWLFNRESLGPTIVRILINSFLATEFVVFSLPRSPCGDDAYIFFRQTLPTPWLAEYPAR